MTHAFTPMAAGHCGHPVAGATDGVCGLSRWASAHTLPTDAMAAALNRTRHDHGRGIQRPDCYSQWAEVVVAVADELEAAAAAAGEPFDRLRFVFLSAGGEEVAR